MRLFVLIGVILSVFIVALGLVNGTHGERIAVYNEAGESVSLNIMARPILFFADWCPHCRAVLPFVAAMPPDQRPVLVDTYYDGPPPLSRIQSELADAGMAGQTFYATDNPPPAIAGVPTLIIPGNGRLITGEQAVISWLRAAPLSIAAAQPK